MQLPILKSPFGRLMIVFLFWLASWTLAGSLFEVYFFNQGLSIADIVSTSMFWYIGALLVTPFFTRIPSRPFMLVGIILPFLASALVYFNHSPEMAFYFRFIIGLSHFFFWIPFNTMFYEFRKQNNAVLGAIYYAITPMLGLVLPAFSGWIASAFSYPAVYLVSMISYATTFILAVKFLENKVYIYNIVESLKAIAGLRSLIFLEGFSATIIISVILEAMLLNYVSEPLQFGMFISTTTVFAVIASLIMAKISDIKQRRREFILASVIGFGLAALLTSQAVSVEQFFLGFGLISFFRAIFFPLPFALAVDNTKKLVDTMIGREFMLGIGRMLGAITGYVVLLYTNIQTMLFFQALAFLLYIPLLEMKKKKLGRI